MEENNVMIVKSKIRKYLKQKHNLQLSASVEPVLTKFVIEMCDGAAESARNDARKTVMDRDFQQMKLKF